MTAKNIGRRPFLQGLAGLGVTTAAGPVLAGCGSAGGDSDDTAGRRLVIRQAIEPGNLDPAFAGGRSDYEVMACVFEGLQNFKGGSLNLVNTLADEFDVSDDGLEIRFALKRGIPFHQGFGEVTAEDVKFSYERIAGVGGHDIGSSYQQDWGALDEVRVTGRYTGVIQLKHTFAPLLATTIPLERGYVISKRAVEERGDGFATAPVGTGPYEFADYRPRQHMLARRFSDYGGGHYTHAAPVEWDEIEFRPVFNDNSAAIGLTTGELDFGPVSPLASKRFGGESGYDVTRHPTFDYRYVGMNQQHPQLRDRRVREAIRHAIDVDAILAATFENAYDRATAIIPPRMPVGYWKGAPAYQRDLGRARRLLAEAGADGRRFRMTSSTDQPGSDVVCQIVQANLAEAGLACDVEVQEPGTFWTLGGEVQQARQLFYCGFSALPDPFWSMVWFTGDQLNQWNFQSFSDKRFDELQQRAARTSDDRKRTRMYVEMQRIWDAAANTVWVTWPTNLFAGRSGLRPSIRADGRPIAWNFRKVT